MSESSFAGSAAVRPTRPVLLGALLCAATAALVWLGVRSTVEWQRSDEQVAARRATETLAFVAGALNRDMKGAHATILSSVRLSQVLVARPYDTADVFGAAFARFPYPESFFVWTAQRMPEDTATLFSRADRVPSWWHASTPPVYPVLVGEEPEMSRPLLRRIRQAATPGEPFVIEHTELAGVPYQVVAHALYTGPRGTDLAGVVGYTVNLDWVRRHYFDELLRQVMPLAAADDGVSVAVLDAERRLVTARGGTRAERATSERAFPLSFFDAGLVSSAPPPAEGLWHLRVAALPTDAAGVAGATRTMLLMTVAASGLLVALFATVRAARVSAQVAALKSEFVSTVTHELKTPVAGIQLVAEALAVGRCSAPERIREYGGMLSLQTRRLSQLLENLLAYARLSDVHQAYVFEALDPGELVDEALDRCGMRLDGLGFRVAQTLPPDLPRIRADRSAVIQVLENLIDNALNYAGEVRELEVSGQRLGDAVELVVRDHGPGIPVDELPHVTDKFFRGRHARTGGSGLGLTIAQRIVADHGGTLAIESVPGRGTAVRLRFPVGRP